MLRQMAPAFAAPYFLNERHGYAMLGSNHYGASCIGSNGQDSIVTEFCATVKRALVRAASALLMAVTNIVVIGAEKQMPVINARRQIAFVEDVHTKWNWPAIQGPRNAMGALPHDMPVAFVVNSTKPNAAPGFCDVLASFLKKTQQVFSRVFAHTDTSHQVVEWSAGKRWMSSAA